MATMRTFTLTENHLKLLGRAYVRWENCEFGAPAIDCKRPYGNSSVISDMEEILGLTDGYDLARAEREAQWEMLNTLHSETETALQVILRTRSSVPGLYVAGTYDQNWQLVEAEKD